MDSTSDPWVSAKTVAMQHLSRYARLGYTHYVAGSLPRQKVAPFVQKMRALYSVHDPWHTTHRKRRSGQAVYQLVVFAESVYEPDAAIYWVLMRTDGELHEAAARERWRDIVRDKICVTGYELVRITKKGAKKPVWTWRYKRETEDGLRGAIVHAIRSRHDERLKELVHVIFESPGFSGVREQVKKMRELILSEWRRRRGDEQMPVEIPKRIGYVRFLPNIGLRASEIGKKKRAARLRREKEHKKIRGSVKTTSAAPEVPSS